MKKLFIHNAFFRIFAPPLFGVFAYLIILLINNNVAQITTLVSNQEVYVSIVLSMISFESMRLTIVLLNRFAKATSTTIIIPLAATTVVSVTIVLIAISQYYQRVIGFDISQRELWIFGIIFTLAALLYNALYVGHKYLHLENTMRIDQEHKLRESLESEFLTFRQDINPDLLYDSLEELILCIHKKTETAEELIDSLAALYRYQLMHRQKEFVKLSEEIHAVQHLIRLANQKHKNAIRWENKMQNTSTIELMPGALIAAIDSILRNTLISADAPLTLTLAQEDDYFVLQHELNDKLQLHPESLIAFQRLQRSYSVYSDRPFVQVKAGRENYIKFPMIVVDHTIVEPA